MKTYAYKFRYLDFIKTLKFIGHMKNFQHISL